MTPRRLIRAIDLAGFRRAVARLALEGEPLDARRRVVIVPTRASVELLRQTLERGARRSGRASVIWPDVLTRDEWMARLHLALPDAPRMLTRVEREVLMAAAAERTGRRPRMGGAPFAVRPGLVAVMLDFYDELRRRQRSMTRFRQALFDELKVERGSDRGSEGLIHQTAFLTLSFLAYERAVVTAGVFDEHLLRAHLLADVPPWPVDHVVVAVADHPTDPRGLWPADFDLLGRWPGLRVDVVMTDEMHDAGFRERLERELPGIVETREPGAAWNPLVVRPANVGPAHEESQGWCHVSRDREEETRDVIRQIRARARSDDPAGLLAPTAIVFQRPLPYLYLARQVCEDAGVPCQALDALPLAAEPYAAVLDLALVVARTGGTRESSLALLRSPLLHFRAVGLRDVAALDAVLIASRVTGGADRYPEEVERFFGDRSRRHRLDAAGARRAAQAAADAALALAPFREALLASDQVTAMITFLRTQQQGPDAQAPWREAYLRARAAVLGALDGLAHAYRQHDDRHREADVLVTAIRHEVERQTFSPGRGRAGVHLVDAVAARFGEFDHVHLVGLVETDWPERQRRSIFYTSGLLKALGWPQDSDHTAAQLAAFRDLTGLPARTLHLHAFHLDGDAIVGLSPMVEVVRGLPSMDGAPLEDVGGDPVVPAEQAAWLAARRGRPPLDDPRYRGLGLPQAPQPYRVSRVDQYVTCPFKYFAESVLGLPEEREETTGLSPLERGTLMHDLFERFYRAWDEAGHGTITAQRLPDAVALFTAMAHDTCAGLPDADRVLEETRLLGSLVARGVAERVFELEAEEGGDVVGRHLEEVLRGPFRFPILGGFDERVIEINGKADRIDRFSDGSLRVVDYKLGRMPDLKTSIQIATYAWAAQQQLEARDHQSHPIAAAMYLAFGDEHKLDGRLGTRREAAVAVQARASEFAGVVSRIEAGEFPARPRSTSECNWCRYAGVCRKEYQLEDDATSSV
ncbi:MAG: PD-(D/E)XK nuclease family protein [Acidobacteria bacterium]|nr:PD-(D/E)XK nuclease family protein [Acidobacteriota bacterium]